MKFESIRKNSFLLAAALLGCVSAFAQASPTSAEIYLGLRKLNVLGSVLYIAAHPDDENTRLLTFFSRDKLYRTGYLSLTRGDGGQNLIGDEQGIELGLIRTQELLSARRIDGAEQFFSRAFDFGFSKTPDETFSKWDREKVLSDVVWVIRKFQPDVIITRFPTTGEGGHGHHTASAILANEAFAAAADPARFPEQLKFVKPWQAKRILWNTFNFGGNTNTISSDQHHFDVGGYNPVLGKSYGEIAADSRSQHKSQGFGVPRSRGEALEYFRQTGGAQMDGDLFDDVTTGWSRVPGGESIGPKVDALTAAYDFLKPQRSVPALVALYTSLKALPAGYWRDQKLADVKDLIEQASGLWLEAFTTEPYAVQGDSVRVNLVLNDRLGIPMTITSVAVAGFDTAWNRTLPPNTNNSLSRTLSIDSNVNLTQPYWLREKMSEGAYTVNDQGLIGRPDVEPALTAVFNLTIAGETLSFSRPVRYKFTDPVKGELYQPLYIIPAATIATGPDILLMQKGEKSVEQATVLVTANRALGGPATIDLRVTNQALSARDAAFSLARNSSKTYSFNVASDSRGDDKQYSYAFAHVQGAQPADAYLAMRSINYAHIPSIRYFLTDPLTILNIDLKTKGKKVGYIVGAGDKVPQALEQMGYEVTMLGEKELARANLKSFDAIISGVRAYNTDEWLNGNYAKLMKYVEEGGNLIVQYNTSNQIGPVRAKIGPYPFTISRNRITDEGAAVTFLKPDHAVLNFPNKIAAEDFKGWIQERSIYHATELDKSYETILRMNDPGEAPDDGSLVIAKYGKGFFTYTGLVFFRELPAGVPGAYRLLANLIALNQKKEI
jgi:LmbE family N-acetylglucosaminyl deacetylase